MGNLEPERSADFLLPDRARKKELHLGVTLLGRDKTLSAMKTLEFLSPKLQNHPPIAISMCVG